MPLTYLVLRALLLSFVVCLYLDFLTHPPVRPVLLSQFSTLQPLHSFPSSSTRGMSCYSCPGAPSVVATALSTTSVCDLQAFLQMHPCYWLSLFSALQPWIFLKERFPPWWVIWCPLAVVKMRPGCGQHPHMLRQKAFTSPGHKLILISGLVRVATKSVGELSDCFPASPWSPAAICCIFGRTEGTNKQIDMRRGKTPKHCTACLKIKLWVIKLDSGRNAGTQDEKTKNNWKGKQKTAGNI